MKRSAPRESAPREPVLRRAYFECRYGQLHVHNAMPAGGGFDEGTPLLCLHDQGQTGRVFSALMREIGRDRSVYAPDLPGSGESDGPLATASVEEAAAAMGDFLQDLRLRLCDVIGTGFGAQVAIELGRIRPQQVRRLVLDGPVAAGPAAKALGKPVLELGTGEAGAGTGLRAFLAG